MWRSDSGVFLNVWPDLKAKVQSLSCKIGMIFQWFSNDVPMVFQWFSNDFQIRFLQVVNLAQMHRCQVLGWWCCRVATSPPSVLGTRVVSFVWTKKRWIARWGRSQIALETWVKDVKGVSRLHSGKDIKNERQTDAPKDVNMNMIPFSW